MTIHHTTADTAPLNGQSSVSETASPAQSRMDQTFKSKWLGALRGGEYQQGVGFLNFENKFCCLGVLCDISGEGRWLEDKDRLDVLRYVIDRNEGQRATLPREIETKYRVSQMGELISMNDGGKSFAEIADYIEANL